MKTKTSLFFSGELTPGSLLWQFCEKRSWNLTACSLLGFKAIPFQVKQEFDVVFIASPRSFNYFKRGTSDLTSIQYAVIGEGSVRKMNVDNSSIVFVGKDPGDPHSVALEFKAWLGNRRVLFPLSVRSAETIAKVIPESQKEIVRCYSTELLPIALKPNDIYVFTSPSNVEAFLLKNELDPAAMIVAWGKTTEKKLVESGFSPRLVLRQSSEEELVSELEDLFPA